MTFAAIDWAMSLEPHWFSTMYGFLFMIGQALMGLAVAIVDGAGGCRPRRRWRRVYNAGHFHDFGKLLFAFTMVWAYLSFSQFLIIWSANLPEEIPWYQHRLSHGWEVIGDRAGGLPLRGAVRRPAVAPHEAQRGAAGAAWRCG